MRHPKTLNAQDAKEIGRKIKTPRVSMVDGDDCAENTRLPRRSGGVVICFLGQCYFANCHSGRAMFSWRPAEGPKVGVQVWGF